MKHASDTYASIGQDKGEKSDCVVRAIAVAACISYDEAHTLLAKHGRRSRRCTRLTTTTAALKELFPNVIREHCRISLARFAMAAPAGHYVAVTSRHALAVTDGVVHDWPKTSARYIVRFYWKLV